MSIIKSFSVHDDNGEDGDMFYIKHDTSSFTIIFYLLLITAAILEKYRPTF